MIKNANEARECSDTKKMKSPLKNGNPQFDLRYVRRCGAKNRKGLPCRAPAMKNSRCRLHGGKSTGPRTPEDLERSRRANWKHGRYSAAAIVERRRRKEDRMKMNQLLGNIMRGKGLLSQRSVAVLLPTLETEIHKLSISQVLRIQNRCLADLEKREKCSKR
jgi:hypothetical protein